MNDRYKKKSKFPRSLIWLANTMLFHFMQSDHCFPFVVVAAAVALNCRYLFVLLYHKYPQQGLVRRAGHY